MSTRTNPCVKANDLFKKKDFQGANKYITKCKKALEAELRKTGTKDPGLVSRQVNIGMLEGNILLKLNRMKKAEEAFQRVLRLLNRREYFREGKELESARGRVYLFLALTIEDDDVRKRVDYLDNSYNCFVSGKQYSQAAEVGVSLVSTFRKMGERERAGELSKQLLKIARKIKDKETRKSLEAQCHLELGRLAENSKNAMRELDRAEKLFNELQSMEGVGQIRLTKILLSAKEGDATRTKEMFQKLLEFAEIHKLMRLQTEVRYHLGIIEAQEGNIDAAFDNLNEALNEQIKSDDPVTAGTALLELARLTFTDAKTDKEYMECIRLIKRSVEKFEQAGEREGLAMAYELRGNILVIQEKIKEAVKYLERAQKIYRDLGHMDSMGRVYTILADAHSISGINALVLQALKKGEKAYRRTMNPLGLADIYQRYALYYINHERMPDKAREYIKKTREVMHKDFPSESVKSLIENHLKRMEKAIS